MASKTKTTTVARQQAELARAEKKLLADRKKLVESHEKLARRAAVAKAKIEARHTKELAPYLCCMDGVCYDKALLALADALTAGQGDGRLSADDVERLLRIVSENGISDVEKATMRRIRDCYSFTKPADARFRQEIKAAG